MQYIWQLIAGIIASISGLLFPTIVAVNAPLPHHTPPVSVTVLFGGDIMLDRSVRTAIEARGGDYIFSCIDPVLKKADVVVANLEGPVTSNASISQGSAPGDSNNYTFTFAPESASLLYKHGVRIVNLGNNHIMNFGAAGARSTMEYLQSAHVEYFGDPIRGSVLDAVIQGVPVTFINYNEFWYPDASTTVSEIRRARAAGRLPIVVPHWGEEYIAANDTQKYLAHSFIDAGAELVVGSHPHVVQEHEQYQGKYIYYSLGNFIFDQYWTDPVRKGLLISVIFSESGVTSVQEIPVWLERDRRTCPLK